MDFFGFIIFLIIAAVVLTLVLQARGRKNFRERVSNLGFTPTKRIGDLCVDESSKKWWVERDMGYPSVHDYGDILDYEIEIDGQKYKTKGGLTRAAVGGLLFGGVGAVVGAATAGQRAVIGSMYMNVFLKGGSIERIYFISSQTKTDSFVYRVGKQTAENVEAQLISMISETTE